MSKIIKSLHANTHAAKAKTIEVRDLFEEQAFTIENHNEYPPNELSDRTSTNAQQEAIIAEKFRRADEQAAQIIAQADNHVVNTRGQLETEKKQAQEEIQQSIISGQEKGYQDGFNKGKLEGQQTYEDIINQANKIIKESEQEFESTIDSAEPVIVEIAVALVKRMIGENIVAQPDVWTSLLRQVMLEVREHENVKLYVHPDWYIQTVGQKEELEQLLSHTEKLFIYPDAGLMENGCVVESQYGRIDATLDRQLQELKTQLLEKLEEGPDEYRGINE